MKFVQPIRDRKKIEAIKKLLRGSNLRDYCLFVLGINSALRISDLLNLTLGDVMNGPKIKDRIDIREKKTRKTKAFPLGDTAQKALREYLGTRTDKSNIAAPLFPSRKGGGTKPLQRAQAWTIINEAARSVGITENIGTHTLRKTFAYHAYQMGKDITLLQQLLNHHSPATTLRYIGITQDDMDDVYLTMNL